MTTVPHRPQIDAAHRWRRRIVLMSFLAWTAGVGMVLWWLGRGHAGPSVWIIRDTDSGELPVRQHLHATFKAELGLQRIYPWILLSPYVALIAWCFPLERDRLRISLPLNLGACACFLVASHAIGNQAAKARTNVLVVNGDTTDAGNASRFGTNTIARGGGPRTWAHPGDAAQPVDVPSEVRVQEEVAETRLKDLWLQLPQGARPPLPSGHPFSLFGSFLDLLTFGAVLGMTHSVHFYRRFREREHSALVLESRLATARLNALSAQLQPHFLFNSLNAIATLVRRDPRSAETMVLSLSELLRLALSHCQTQQVPLRDELEFIRHYCDIQQIRFGEKLRIEQEIEPAALDCLVPTLCLQPLVENAIRHGIEPADRPGLVRVSASRREETLVVVVEDDGVGLATPPFAWLLPDAQAPPGLESDRDRPTAGSRNGGTGIGLANLRARLEALHGERGRLVLKDRPGGGVTACLEIPVPAKLTGEVRAQAAS
jgi:signal transduction histidine kinase